MEAKMLLPEHIDFIRRTDMDGRITVNNLLSSAQTQQIADSLQRYGLLHKERGSIISTTYRFVPPTKPDEFYNGFFSQIPEGEHDRYIASRLRDETQERQRHGIVRMEVRQYGGSNHLYLIYQDARRRAEGFLIPQGATVRLS